MPNVALDLKNLRATRWFTVELKDESGIRLGLDIQVELGRGAFGFLTQRNPAIVEDGSLGLRSGEIQWHGHFTQEPARAEAASSPPTTSVDGNVEAELAGEEGLGGELVEVGGGEVEGGGDGVEVGVGEGGVGGNEGDEGGLRREGFEGDAAEAGGGGGVDEGGSRLGSEGDLEGEVADSEADERTGVHGNGGSGGYEGEEEGMRRRRVVQRERGRSKLMR